MREALLDERQRRFVEKPRVAVLATVGPGGAPHTAPVWYVFDGGAFLVLTDRASQKHRNVVRDPRVELCIDDKQPPYHTVIVRGAATVEEPRPGLRAEMATHYLGEDAARRYLAQSAPDNVMLRIVPEKVVGW
ncbi:MAG: PPOX class F420-dependent oxidoreductase [Dehalococcoidia bacterium]